MSDGKKRFKLFSELEATSTKDWLVDKFLGAGEQSAQYGRPGDGKSVLAEDMGLHVSSGMPWHGRPVRRGLVVYFALERSQLVARRAVAFRKKHGVSDLPFAIVSGVWDFRDRRTITQVLEIIREIEAATGEQIVLVIIDTLSRALCGGDENGKDMGAVVSTTGWLQQETGAHVMLVHHIPQDGAERLRGHGSLLGAMDTTIYVEKRGNIRTATIIKANDAEEGEQITFTLESVPIGAETNAPVVVPAENAMRAKSVEPSLTKNQQTLFSLLSGAGAAGLTTEQWNEQARAVDIGTRRKADLYDIRAALKSKGLIRQYGDRWNVC